jgi:hypothetical protein
VTAKTRREIERGGSRGRGRAEGAQSGDVENRRRSIEATNEFALISGEIETFYGVAAGAVSCLDIPAPFTHFRIRFYARYAAPRHNESRGNCHGIREP